MDKTQDIADPANLVDEITEGTSHFRTKDIDQAAFIWCQDGAKLDRYFAAINSAIEKIEGNA